MICLKWYCECELAMYLFSITLFFSKCICLLMLLIIYNMPREFPMCLFWFIYKNRSTWKFWAHVLKELMVEYLELVCAQSCLTLCNPLGCSLPGCSVHGISRTRTLKWIAISFTRGSSTLRDQTPSLASPASAGRFFTSWATGKSKCWVLTWILGLPH